MNEPNKGLLTHEKAQELVQRALDNRDLVGYCSMRLAEIVNKQQEVENK